MLHQENLEKFSQLNLPEININFKVIARLQENDKLFIRDFKYIEIDNSYIKPISRTIKNMYLAGYNREDIIDFLLFLTDQLICITNKLIAKDETILVYEGSVISALDDLIINIKQSLLGFGKLKVIYHSNDAIQSRLDTIIETLNKRINFLGEFIKKNENVQSKRSSESIPEKSND
jgi:hypothetical protein